MQKTVILLAAMSAVTFTATPAMASPALADGLVPEWRVKDRFRLFERANVDARGRVQQLLSAIGATSETPLVEYYDAFLETLSGSGASGHSASLRTSNYQPAGDEAHRSAGRYSPYYLFPDAYSIEVRATSDPSDNRSCRYSSEVETRLAACASWTPLAVARGQDVSLRNWTVATQVRIEIVGGAATTIPVSFRDRLVVALGDSYISGEGNPDVPSIITDQPDRLFRRAGWGSEAVLGVHVLSEAKWWDEPCHRSLLSWPVLTTLAHAARNPHQAITLVHLGCSGAVTGDIDQHGEGDLPGGGDETESQLAILAGMLSPPNEAWGRRTIDTTLLSIGGNDIGFAGVLSTLLLPPNGYTLGPAIAREVGKNAGAVCPYNDSGNRLARLCDTQPSAQTRLAELGDRLQRLAASLASLGANRRVIQVEYPNPLSGADGYPCDTRPEGDAAGPSTPHDLSRLDPSTGHVIPFSQGFEALMGIIPRQFRGGRYSWGFELQYVPDGRRLDTVVLCDDVADGADSEVCQATLIHRWLNQTIRMSAARLDFRTVNGHVDATLQHGVCRGNSMHKRWMPRVQEVGRSHSWLHDYRPSNFPRYSQANPRWFRTTNDSILTQFGFHDGEPRFIHGTAHPTYRSHLAYAQAVLESGLFE